MGVPASHSFFISYRRDDTGAEAGRLRDSLVERLGRETVFLDLEAIELGKDYLRALDSALASCDVMLVLIGREWETISDARGRPRLRDPRDILRIEVLAGLERGIPVVPVLLNRDTLPAPGTLPKVLIPLTRRQHFEIRRDRWHQDVELLLERLGITSPRTSDTAADSQASQARHVSATVEWKRVGVPDPNPRRWVVYVDNLSDAPITVEEVLVKGESAELTIQDWEPVRPSVLSDYELDEAAFDPRGERPAVSVRFVDSVGQRWLYANNSLRPYKAPSEL